MKVTEVRKERTCRKELQKRLLRGYCAHERLGPQDPPLLFSMLGGRHHFQSTEKIISMKTAKSFLTLTFF